MIAAPCESADKVYGFTDSVGSRVVGESSDFGAAIEFLTGIRVIRISNVNMVRVIEVGVKCHSHKTILTCGLVNVGERCTAELCAIDRIYSYNVLSYALRDPERVIRTIKNI